jgi:hypothetical protein
MIKKRVMAKVIEFYVPKNFRNAFVRAVQPQPGTVISSFLRRQRSQSRLDQLVGSSGGSWQRQSRTMLQEVSRLHTPGSRREEARYVRNNNVH